MKSKEQLAAEIQDEIEKINKKIGNSWSSEMSDATNRVALSNLYFALVKLSDK